MTRLACPACGAEEMDMAGRCAACGSFTPPAPAKRQTLAEEFDGIVRYGGATGSGADYVRHYNRGWQSTNLETGDGIADNFNREAWFDGYSDAGAGREKWHIPRCGDKHHNGPGGCGAA